MCFVVDRNAVMRRMTVLWSQNQWLDRWINCVILLRLKQNTFTAIKEEIGKKYILVQKKNFVKICPGGGGGGGSGRGLRVHGLPRAPVSRSQLTVTPQHIFSICFNLLG